MEHITHTQTHSSAHPANEDEDQQVRNEEGTPTILIGSCGEPPDIAQANRCADAGEEELSRV